MKKIYLLAILTVLCNFLNAQTICNPSGNVVIFSNYDGGVLDINVDVNIPNLKIGVVSYEMVTINLSGPFVSNVTAVQFAGYTTTTHHHCTNSPAVTSIIGAPPGTDTIVFMPQSPVANTNGYYIIICNTSCDTNNNQGGCNTPDQVAAYFLQEFGGALRFHNTQYGCWSGSQSISAGGNCCVGAVTTPAFPVASFQSSDTSFCDKQCIDFVDLSTNNPTSWQWFFPGADSTTSNLQNPTNICYNNFGSFDVTLIACNAAGCDTLVMPGFINEYPAPVPAIIQSGDTLFSTPGIAYQWWNVATGLIAGATNSYYIPTTGGDYYVIVTDSVGCEGSSNVITVSFAAVNSPGPFTKGWTIVPNPSDGTFTIQSNDIASEKLIVQIIDQSGKTIYNEEIKSGMNNQIFGSYRLKIKAAAIPPGIYCLRIITEQNAIPLKLVISR